MISKKYFKKKNYLNKINNKNKMNNDFYNRVFLSNKLLNTATVQPVIRPAKIEDGEINIPEKKVEHVLTEENRKNQENKIKYLENQIESFEEKIKCLFEKVEVLESGLKSLEENRGNIMEFELNEFDNMIVTEDS